MLRVLMTGYASHLNPALIHPSGVPIFIGIPVFGGPKCYEFR